MALSVSYSLGFHLLYKQSHDTRLALFLQGGTIPTSVTLTTSAFDLGADLEVLHVINDKTHSITEGDLAVF